MLEGIRKGTDVRPRNRPNKPQPVRGRFHRGTFRPYASRNYRTKRKPRWSAKHLTLAVTIIVLFGLAGFRWVTGGSEADKFACISPRVLDGDTIDCGVTRVRLQGIDAPELPGHCRPGRNCTPGDPYASTENLRRLVSGKTLQCRKTDTDGYGRTVARCKADDVDVSCAQIAGGYAVRRYAAILC